MEGLLSPFTSPPPSLSQAYSAIVTFFGQLHSFLVGFCLFEYIPSPQRHPTGLKIVTMSLLLSTAFVTHGTINYSTWYSSEFRGSKLTKVPAK